MGSCKPALTPSASQGVGPHPVWLWEQLGMTSLVSRWGYQKSGCPSVKKGIWALSSQAPGAVIGH